MLQVSINGKPHIFPEGTTILRALQSLEIKIPALCDDPRLEPAAACRLCMVEVDRNPRPVSACRTFLSEGMQIQTHSRPLEQARQAILRLLAQEHFFNSEKCGPELPLEQEAARGRRERLMRDESHPYILVDMTRCIYCLRCVRICEEVQGQDVWRVWNRGNATRLRPDHGSTLGESSCVSCGTCVDACPSGALEDKSVRVYGVPTSWTRTVCPYCGVGCELKVGVRKNQITQIRPVIDAPVNKGHLCVKGRYAFEFNSARDRVTEPMIRKGKEWKQVSWDEALQFTAGRLHDLVRRHGPDSIGVLGSARATNEENYLAQKFARVVLQTNNVDCCARVCHAPTAAAMRAVLGTGAATNSYDDVEKAAAFLLCGTNPTENHPIVGARIRQAVRKGARLILVDPRETELTSLADVHLALKPGTNVLLLNALASVIVREQLYDSDFIRERVDDWEGFQVYFRNFSLEAAATITGVPEKQIIQAARLYARNKPAICFHGLGITEHHQGSEAVMCLVNLALLTGNLGKPGSGVNPLRGQNNVQGSAHMGCDPGCLPGAIPIEAGRKKFEDAWGTVLPRTRGLTVVEMLDPKTVPGLKALWTIGYDVLLSHPNAKITSRLLQSLEFVIVQDLFLNETALECGSVFFPVASSYEKEGTFMNSERRVQKVRKAVQPPGNVLADWEIICRLARQMGAAAQFNYSSPESIWNEVRTLWDAGAGLSYSRLEHRGLQWPCPSESHPGTSILHATSFPDGPRASLRTISYRPGEETATAEFPFLLMTGRTLWQFNAGTMTMRTRNTQFRPADTLDISPGDAERLGLIEGDRARVRSRYGQAIMPVRIGRGVKPGELFATFHTPRSFLNRLTGPARDNLAQTPEYKLTAVQVTKAGFS